jgi:hypothetical protein
MIGVVMQHSGSMATLIGVGTIMVLIVSKGNAHRRNYAFISANNHTAFKVKRLDMAVQETLIHLAVDTMN